MISIPTSGNLCCLSVDAANHRTKGDCRPSEQCPSENIVLACDDDSDCKQLKDPGAFCNLRYHPMNGDRLWSPGSIALSQCALPTVESVGSTISLGLCAKREEHCIDGKFACMSTSADIGDNLLPGYFWCAVTVSP